MRLRSNNKNLKKLGLWQPGQTPLSSLKPGERGVVVGLSGGHRFMCRMVSLGFTSGVEVTVVQNFGRGPMIVTIKDTQIALGRGEALKVLVEAL